MLPWFKADIPFVINELIKSATNKLQKVRIDQHDAWDIPTLGAMQIKNYHQAMELIFNEMDLKYIELDFSDASVLMDNLRRLEMLLMRKKMN